MWKRVHLAATHTNKQLEDVNTLDLDFDLDPQPATLKKGCRTDHDLQCELKSCAPGRTAASSVSIPIVPFPLQLARPFSHQVPTTTHCPLALLPTSHHSRAISP